MHTGTVGFVVCPTSWTEDEDFDVIIDAVGRPDALRQMETLGLRPVSLTERIAGAESKSGLALPAGFGVSARTAMPRRRGRAGCSGLPWRGLR